MGEGHRPAGDWEGGERRERTERIHEKEHSGHGDDDDAVGGDVLRNSHGPPGGIERPGWTGGFLRIQFQTHGSDAVGSEALHRLAMGNSASIHVLAAAPPAPHDQ